MKREKRRRLPWVLMALGAAMALFALAMLGQGRPVLQYCVPGTASEADGGALRALSGAAAALDEAKAGASASRTSAAGMPGAEAEC